MSFGCGGAVAYRRRYLPCWGLCDGQRRTVVMWLSASPYYGPTFHCCYCGDIWGDGYLRERPFRRGWRKAAIRDAQAMWERAQTGPVVRDAELYVVPDAYRDADTAIGIPSS